VDVVGNLKVQEYLAWWRLAYLHQASFILSFSQSDTISKKFVLLMWTTWFG
jgi:hypothetical protein